jgi:hypothetical protein
LEGTLAADKGAAGLVGSIVDAQGPEHVVSGVVQKVDGAAKTLTLEAKDGSEVVVHESENTVKYGGRAAKQGSHAVVHYTGQGAKATAQAVKHIGAKSLQVTVGTVTKVDAGAKTVAVKSKEGGERVHHLAKDGSISAGEGREGRQGRGDKHGRRRTSRGSRSQDCRTRHRALHRGGWQKDCARPSFPLIAPRRQDPVL